jgi:hypothetical protein
VQVATTEAIDEAQALSLIVLPDEVVAQAQKFLRKDDGLILDTLSLFIGCLDSYGATEGALTDPSVVRTLLRIADQGSPGVRAAAMRVVAKLLQRVDASALDSPAWAGVFPTNGADGILQWILQEAGRLLLSGASRAGDSASMLASPDASSSAAQQYLAVARALAESEAWAPRVQGMVVRLIETGLPSELSQFNGTIQTCRALLAVLALLGPGAPGINIGSKVTSLLPSSEGSLPEECLVLALPQPRAVPEGDKAEAEDEVLVVPLGEEGVPETCPLSSVRASDSGPDRALLARLVGDVRVLEALVALVARTQDSLNRWFPNGKSPTAPEVPQGVEPRVGIESFVHLLEVQYYALRLLDGLLDVASSAITPALQRRMLQLLVRTCVAPKDEEEKTPVKTTGPGRTFESEHPYPHNQDL